MKLAVLSNFVVSPIVESLDKSFELYLPSGFDTWQQELTYEKSGLYEFAPDVVVILLYADAYKVVLSHEALPYKWKQAVETFSKNMPHVPILLSADCDFSEQLSWGDSKVFNLPIRRLAARYGDQVFYSRQYWYLNSQPYSINGIQVVKRMILNYIRALTGERKKCLAVDLDNTLWGGVIGEDGIAGIALAENGNGAQFKDAQRLIKHMQQLGIILVILSKNNPADVDLAFTHPDMVLRREDFVAEYINWNPKSENIKDCAKALNIGLDSFVFLDDSPVERAEMRANAPDVTAVDFDCDSVFLPQLLSDVYDAYFLTMEVLPEDAEKTKMYRADMTRKASVGQSFEECLQDMGMYLDFHLVQNELEQKRLFQLMHKTNQFNNGVKLSENDFCKFLEASDTEVYAVGLSDKFGFFGIIAGILVRYLGNGAIIESLFMSCRAMGRKVEYELLARLKERLIRRGAENLRVVYRRTDKNSPFERFVEAIPPTVEKLPDKTGLFMEG